MSLLWKDDSYSGVYGIRKQEWCTAKGEGSTIGADKLFDGERTRSALLFAISLQSCIRVTSQMTFLEECSVQEDAQSMKSSTAQI